MNECQSFLLKWSILGIFFSVVIAACSNIHKNNIPNQKSAKVVLGHYLFFEKKLTVNATKSCASCHDPILAFSDGYRRSVGVFGDEHPRNAPSLVNVAYRRSFNLANPDIRSLVQQIHHPLYGTQPIEMGVEGNEEMILQRIAEDSIYKKLFAKAYPTIQDKISWKHIIACLAAYTSTLNSMNAPYDKYLAGDENVLTPSAKRGRDMFFSPRLRCGSCHNGIMLSTNSRFSLDTSVLTNYVNIGIYTEKENLSPDKGLMNITHDTLDEGKYIIPSLRNVCLTAPYMHDGSIATLTEVLRLYSKGGKPNKCKDKRISAFPLTSEEEKDIINFLESLTDTTYLRNPHFRNPF